AQIPRSFHHGEWATVQARPLLPFVLNSLRDSAESFKSARMDIPPINGPSDQTLMTLIMLVSSKSTVKTQMALIP
ncbi:MAG: hypothetical protein NTV80_01175, partial [Verrucomicrobia bacterium]|nr:hypothetical protein [Verrucomicrobiota bacterium]